MSLLRNNKSSQIVTVQWSKPWKVKHISTEKREKILQSLFIKKESLCLLAKVKAITIKIQTIGQHTTRWKAPPPSSSRVNMVQKYQSPVRVYKYPFELLMRAYELRFPTCDMIPIIKETEIIEEDLSPDEAVHMIDRRAKLNVEAPYLLKKLMGVDFLLFR